MVRTIIEPKGDQLIIPLAPEYKGKKLEVIYYSLDEITEDNTPSSSFSFSKLRGIISGDEANQLQEYIQKSRSEWDSHI